MAKALKSKKINVPDPQEGKLKEPVYEFVLTEIAVQQVDNFIALALSAKQQEMLDSEKAFDRLVTLLKTSIKRREVKEE